MTSDPQSCDFDLDGDLSGFPAPKPKLNPDGSLDQFMLLVDGVRQVCGCGCNVFHYPDCSRLELKQCNSCGFQFETV